MTEMNQLTRRKILASMGAVGAAGAVAGMGTSAFFNDEESFTDNSITAGTLDMKVDWEEHYSYPQLYGFDDPASNLDATRSEPSDTSNYTAFPPGVEANTDLNPILWVHNDDVSDYMDNTSIEAFPDSDDDGVQDDFDEANACDVLTDVGVDDDGLSADNRTDNSATDPGDPLVNLGDVKPGDFGEVTLSFHLCENPGYVWLNASNASAAENGITEPEGDSDEEDGDGDSTDMADVELLDEIQTAWWYDDNCDNLTQGGTTTSGEADVMIVADGSGSVTSDSSKFQALQDGAEDLVNALGSNVRVGLTVFSNDANTVATLADSKSDTISEIQDDNNYPGGGTDIGAGIDEGQSELTSGTGSRSGVDKILVVLTNGVSSSGRSEATSAKNAGTTIYGIAYGSGADENLIEDISSPPKVDDGSITSDDEFAFIADQTDIGDVFDDIGGQISTGEEIFFQGDLRTALGVLTSNKGIPLDADGDGDFDEINDSPDAETRGCFDPTPETNCIGFSWWVPTDVGNQIQSDSVSFDLGFYTEQCRHNDGSGQTT